jgi:hypothetical protein
MPVASCPRKPKARESNYMANSNLRAYPVLGNTNVHHRPVRMEHGQFKRNKKLFRGNSGLAIPIRIARKKQNRPKAGPTLSAI